MSKPTQRPAPRNFDWNLQSFDTIDQHMLQHIPPGAHLTPIQIERLKELETQIGADWEVWQARFVDWHLHAFAEVAYCKGLTTQELYQLLKEPPK